MQSPFKVKQWQAAVLVSCIRYKRINFSLIKVVPNNDKLNPDFHIMVRIDPHSLKMCSGDRHDHIETPARRSGQLCYSNGLDRTKVCM